MAVTRTNKPVKVYIPELLMSKDPAMKQLGKAALKVDGRGQNLNGKPTADDFFLDEFEAQKLPDSQLGTYGVALKNQQAHKAQRAAARAAEEMVGKIASYSAREGTRFYIQFNQGKDDISPGAALVAVRNGSTNINVEVWKRYPSDAGIPWDGDLRSESSKIENGSPLKNLKAMNAWLATSGASYVSGD